MAELHPEECRSRLHRVGERGQVGDAASSFIPSLLAISHFPASPVLHHSMDPLLKSLQPCWWGGSLWFWAGRGEKKEKKKSMMAGGRLKWSLGEWGWTIFEFKSPFNICSSQWGLGRGGRLGRRWEAFWSVVSWWHMGNGSWFPPVLLSVFVSLLYLPVLIFAVRCRLVVFFFFCSSLLISLHFSL